MVEVEYLETTVGRPVLTGYHPTSAIGYDVKFRVANSGWIFRSGNTYNTDIIGVYGATTGTRVYLHFPNINEYFESLVGVDVTAILAGNKATVNGTTRTIASFSYPYDYELRFFPSGSSRLYYAKFYESGTLVRDFVPVRVESTGYLFDKVTGSLFGNSGTGSFILGPDKIS